MTELPLLVCSDCDQRYDVRSLAWRCTCGGVLDVDSGAMTLETTTLTMTEMQSTRTTMWRYESVLPVPFDGRVSLGEGMSPIVASKTVPGVGLKLDFLMPTLSFKDRGAVVLATLAAQIGVRSAVVDSSGNAGTAAAAYLGRAGVACRVLVPASTSPGKLAQLHALVAAGLAPTMPALVAVQADGCAPVAASFAAGLDTVAPVAAGPTVAEGIAIAAPPRGAQILSAIRESGGAVVSVSDDDVLAARAELAAEGLYVEPTSAVCWAAVRAAGRPDVAAQGWNWALARDLLSGENVILPLCGAGLKVPA